MPGPTSRRSRTAPRVAGQTLTFQVRVEMDDDVDTSFYFDSLSVSADVCP